MFDIMKNLLKEEYGIDGVSPSSDFRRDLGLSSFDLMNLLCIVEDKFDIELDEEHYRHISTAGEMCSYIEELIKEKKL